MPVVRGIGIDAVSIARCEQKTSRHYQLLQGICAPGEPAPTSAAEFARRWAVKEAVAKACGERLTPRQVRVLHTPEGAPYVEILGGEHEGEAVLVSVSDDAGVAVAVAVR